MKTFFFISSKKEKKLCLVDSVSSNELNVLLASASNAASFFLYFSDLRRIIELKEADNSFSQLYFEG